MTMFEFMLNALYMLAGVVCIVVAVLIVYCASVTVYRAAIALHIKNSRTKK